MLPLRALATRRACDRLRRTHAKLTGYVCAQNGARGRSACVLHKLKRSIIVASSHVAWKGVRVS